MEAASPGGVHVGNRGGRGTRARSGRRVRQPGGRAAAAAARSPAAGRPFLRYAPGGARFACSWLSPPQSRAPGGLEGKPGHRFADASRSARPGLGVRKAAPGSLRGRAGARGAAGGGDSGGPAALASCAYKSGAARGGGGRRGPAASAPRFARGVDISPDSRGVPWPALPGTQPPAGGGGGGWRLRGWATEGAHPRAGGRDAAGMNFA